MLTTPITTPLFHSQVLTLLSNHLSNPETGPNGEETVPTIPALSATDTPLAPGDTIGQFIGIVSPWIDLSSPDPLIYDVSRQVLELELKYAAFCGLNNVIVPGPNLHYGDAHGEGVAQYAYALQEALSFSIYTQVMIKVPMMDHPDYEGDDIMGSLVPFSRPKYVREGGKRKVDLLGTWDAWHIIRSVCKYNARLFVGKNAHSRSLKSLTLTSLISLCLTPEHLK